VSFVFLFTDFEEMEISTEYRFWDIWSFICFSLINYSRHC
jgi:hypothetical protein